MSTKKSSKNKTIDTSIEEGKHYLNNCVRINEINGISTVLNKTILGDTFLILDKLPKQSIDLLIVDPPYNLYKNYHGNKFIKTTENSYEDFTRLWIEKIIHLLKPTASIYVCCDWESSLIIGKVLGDYFQIRNRITWQREKGRGALSNWKNSMEDIWFATLGKDYTFNVEDVKVRKKVIAPYRVEGKPKDWEETKDGNFRNSYPSNFWDDISIPYWSMPENTAHPTQKPEKLLAKLILASSNEKDVILDPFLGSGSTSVTAKKLGRSYIGIEQNPLYCIWSEIRLEKAEVDKSIQGFSQGVFWERNTLAEQEKAKRGNEKECTTNLFSID